MTDKPSYDQLTQEVERIAQFLSQAKREIASISTAPDADKHLGDASEELSEVVRHTEEATNTIMDNADAILALAGTMPDAELSGQLTAHGLGILEACSFQDITGQRIKKVMKTLEQVEVRLGNLIKLFGGTLPEGIHGGDVATGDAALLNGPQARGKAPDQDEVDKLFSSL